MSTIDHLIANAPEVAIDPEPVTLNPTPEPEKKAETSAENKDESVPTDDFHADPLIVEALKIFKGRLIS